MAEDEEYEILPNKLLSDLKFEVEALKKKLVQPDNKMNELILEIESMKDSIHELNVIFEKALEITKGEDVSKTIAEMKKRIDIVTSQNETIARGMIAISDKLEEFMQKQSPGLASMPGRPSASLGSAPGIQHIMGSPQAQGRMAPRPETASMDFGADVPPPPPNLSGEKKRRVGLFS